MTKPNKTAAAASETNAAAASETTGKAPSGKVKASKAKPVTAIASGVVRTMKMVSLAVISWENDRDIGEEDEGPEGLPALVRSVQNNGIETPVILRLTSDNPDAEPCYRVDAGRRRCEAAKRAGLSEVPAVVLQPGEDGDLVAFRENTLRRALSPYETVMALYRISEKGLAGPQISEHTGLSATYINSCLRVARKCCASALAALKAGTVTLQVAFKLATMSEADQLLTLAGENPKTKASEEAGEEAGDTSSGAAAEDDDADAVTAEELNKRVESNVAAAKVMAKLSGGLSGKQRNQLAWLLDALSVKLP